MNWQVLDEELQSQNFERGAEVQIITPIRNRSVIPIKDNSNLIVLYFIQELRHNSKLENFSESFLLKWHST